MAWSVSCRLNYAISLTAKSLRGFIISLMITKAATIAHFADMVAILNSIVLNIYYGMLRGQINMYLPPEHPIIDIQNTE